MCVRTCAYMVSTIYNLMLCLFHATCFHHYQPFLLSVYETNFPFKMLFHHQSSLKGMICICLFKGLFYYPSWLYHSKLLRLYGTSTIIHSILRNWYVNICMHIFNSCFYYPSFLFTIFLRGHCSINPCFWKGVDVACQTFLSSSYITLSFHTTRKQLFYPYSLLWEGIGFIYVIYIYIINISFKNISYNPSLRCQSMLLGGGGCCMPNCSFIILHYPVIPYYPEKTILPLFTPLGGLIL